MLDTAQKNGMLTDQQFAMISQIARRRAGLEIPAQKNAMVHARLTKRIRDLRLPDIQAYCDLITGDAGDGELQNLISVLTTNVTSFYREAHHFETLRSSIIPKLRSKAERGQPVRIWSAGCSEGMELLTVAIELLSAWPDIARHDVRLLGTDIDQAIIEKARRAEYAPAIRSQIPENWVQKYFEATDFGIRAHANLRRLVTYNSLNLLEPWPMRQKFDVIFCRNVVIYFDEATRSDLWPRFADLLTPDGTLFVGHSERVTGPAERMFKLTGTTTYMLAQNTPPHTRPLQKDDKHGTT